MHQVPNGSPKLLHRRDRVSLCGLQTGGNQHPNQTARTLGNLVAKAFLKENLMNADELFLRSQLFKWDTRFHHYEPQNHEALIQLKHEFWRKYGFDELERVSREVEREASRAILAQRVHHEGHYHPRSEQVRKKREKQGRHLPQGVRR